MKIAMWSGPRNLSTAMMYAFAARGDCAVWDEPFYAPYLAATGLPHPMRDKILNAHEANPSRVARRCGGPIPDGKSLFYMKHMPHHMLAEFPLDWARGCANVLLIRHPTRVIASYIRKRESPTAADIGFAAQSALFDRMRAWDLPVWVIDSTDIRSNPGTMLRMLCNAVGISYTDKMLNWPAGGHAEDGVWAQHWYGAVHRSTGFDGADGPLPALTGHAMALADEAVPHYDRMRAQAITPPTSQTR